MNPVPPPAARGLSPTLRLLTPEGVVFRLPLAGPVARALAWAIDVAAISAALALLSTVVAALGFVLPALASMLGMLGGFVVLTLYAAALEWTWRGQTLGKRVLGLRVVDAHGLPLLGAQVLVRNLLRAVDALPLAYLVGGLACLFGRHAQRIGDRVAGTVVVRSRKLAPPDLSAWQNEKYNSLARYSQLALRLRERATPAEAQLAFDALVQRDRLSPRTRLAVYRDLVDYFQSRVAFPPEATDALSPEQYLRAVVAILFPKAPAGARVTR